MSATPDSGLTTAVVFLALIVLILVRRTYRLVRGALYSTARLVGFSVFYSLLFGLFAFTTLYAAVGVWGNLALLLVIPYGAVVAGAALVSAPYIRRIVRFESRADGRWYYRLPMLVPVLYLGLFLLRFAIELVVFGVTPTTTVLPTTLSTPVLVVLVAVDLLLGVSAGLLIGRSIGVYRAFGERAVPPVPAASPLRPGGGPGP